MTGLSARLTAEGHVGRMARWQMVVERRLEAAALLATDRAATIAKTQLRGAMQGAGLGRLGYAIGSTSDLQKGGRIHRTANGFSVSGAIFVRSRSERTQGAIEAYTRGAAILPRKSRWLWIPTDQIPRIASNRERLTPALWKSSGLDSKIGPLVMVRRPNGFPLLVVKGVSVALSGKKRGAKAFRQNGMARRGQSADAVSIVAFIGIPNTSRAARVNVSQILREVQAQLPALFNKSAGVV